MATFRPIRRFVLLLDDQPERDEGGVIVRSSGYDHMDFVVVAVGERETVDFGVGDRVVLADRYAGRRVMLDGVLYRLVRTTDIVAAVEE